MWSPQAGPQTEAIQSTWCPQLLFGGARGGGKSDFLLGDYLQDVQTYGPHWKGLLLRQTFPQLQELLKRSLQMFPEQGGVWKAGAKEWQFPNGATLLMRQAENMIEASNYQGHSYSWIGMDEGTQWAEVMEIWNMLSATLRSGGARIPTKRRRMTANPGGPGHDAVKMHFIDHAPMGFVPRRDEATGERIMFIPSRVTDNKILLLNDPNYINQLRGVGSAELVRRWLEGDWSVIVGAYFKEFKPERHIIRPCSLPKHLMRIMGHDWGSASPFSCLWAGVSDGTFKATFLDGYSRTLPAGALIIYREYYGADEKGKGLKLKVEEIADAILSRENEAITFRVADTSIFDEDGGPSIAETFKKHGVGFRPSDKRRLPGWQQIRSRLVGEDNKPMIFIFDTCTSLIRFLPALQHDRTDAEDVDTNGQDHAPDALRYICMSRPYVKEDIASEPMRTMSGITLDELWKADKNKYRSPFSRN